MSIGSRTLKLLGREISKQLKSLFQKQSVISDKNSATSCQLRLVFLFGGDFSGGNTIGQSASNNFGSP
jgi:hypothetical protein